MRRILICVLFAILAAAPLANAQDQNSWIDHLAELSRQNQLPQLIQAANSLLANHKLTPAEQGIAMTYLGHAYQKGGDFHAATGYYEKALALLERDGQHPSEYATTLAAMATLYADTGQTDTAKHILLRSVHLLEKDGDHHDRTAMIWNNLATLAADGRSTREAHKFMARSIAESERATNICPDETSTLLITQARIAELDRDPHAAIADFQHALALWTQSHDDQHPDTAWLYVLLGGAYLQAGDIASARQFTSRGLTLLGTSSGRQSSLYFLAELAYSRVLDASGSHEEASTLRKEAQAALNTGTDRQRANSEISVAALR
jgi:tetratricopeptide (TPR) repeat protein